MRTIILSIKAAGLPKLPRPLMCAIAGTLDFYRYFSFSEVRILDPQCDVTQMAIVLWTKKNHAAFLQLCETCEIPAPICTLALNICGLDSVKKFRCDLLEIFDVAFMKHKADVVEYIARQNPRAERIFKTMITYAADGHIPIFRVIFQSGYRMDQSRVNKLFLEACTEHEFGLAAFVCENYAVESLCLDIGKDIARKSGYTRAVAFLK